MAVWMTPVENNQPIGFVTDPLLPNLLSKTLLARRRNQMVRRQTSWFPRALKGTIILGLSAKES